jgi:hypothetical protein
MVPFFVVFFFCRCLGSDHGLEQQHKFDKFELEPEFLSELVEQQEEVVCVYRRCVQR